MPDWSDQSPLRVMQQRAFLCAQIRAFFQARQVLEVATPVLSSCGNTDLQIDPFVSDALTGDDTRSFLRTSPEFFHKRLLSQGMGDLFEIGQVFRRGERSPRHNPEFLLLEWYRLGFGMQDLMDEVVELLQTVRQAFGLEPMPVVQISFQRLFESTLGIDPLVLSLQALNGVCAVHGYHGDDLNQTQALDFLFGVALAPQLDPNKVLLLHHFPVEQAALAMQDPDDARCALRFELLWGGVELANGYQELTDADEQQRRFEADNLNRANMDKPEIPMDHRLLTAMQAGLPACSGVAIGLDRLLMCLVGAPDIQSVMPFVVDQA